jgi:Fe-S cluster assembly ATP-binding protein
MARARRRTELDLDTESAGKLTKAMADFEIDDLRVSVEGREILKGVSLAVNKGEVHAVMGPNGSGKSTLSYTLMGHPNYKVTGGHAYFKGKDILTMQPEERAKLGMFLALQYPVVVPGITMSNFLRTAINAKRGYDGKDKSKAINVKEFRQLLGEEMAVLRMDKSFLSRYVNEGFSGGEKKRAEILQMAVLKPEIAILDETDSGLDIDSIKFVSDAVNRMRGPELGVLIITHYTRILKYIKPDYVHVLVNGEFVRSGGSELADWLEAKGYSEWVKEPAKEPAGMEAI